MASFYRWLTGSNENENENKKEIEKLQREVQQLKTNRDELISQHETLLLQSRHITAERDLLDATLQSKSMEIGNLTTDRDDMRQRVSAFKRELMDKEDAMKQLQENEHRLRREVKELQAKVNFFHDKAVTETVSTTLFGLHKDFLRVNDMITLYEDIISQEHVSLFFDISSQEYGFDDNNDEDIPRDVFKQICQVLENVLVFIYQWYNIGQVPFLHPKGGENKKFRSTALQPWQDIFKKLLNVDLLMKELENRDEIKHLIKYSSWKSYVEKLSLLCLCLHLNTYEPFIDFDFNCDFEKKQIVFDSEKFSRPEECNTRQQSIVDFCILPPLVFVEAKEFAARPYVFTVVKEKIAKVDAIESCTTARNDDDDAGTNADGPPMEGMRAVDTLEDEYEAGMVADSTQ